MNPYEFHSPREMYFYALTTFGAISRGNPWIRKVKWTRELYEISSFGVGVSLLSRQLVEIRLSKEEPADGQSRCGSDIVDIQTTTRNRERRQPDREYKGRIRNPESRKAEAPEATEDQTIEWIKEAVKSKVDKHYSNHRPFYLLVHANFKKNGLDILRLQDEVGKLAQTVFGQIWLLTGIISQYPHPFAIGRLYPPTTEAYLAYDVGSGKDIPRRELHRPFGPMELPGK